MLARVRRCLRSAVRPPPPLYLAPLSAVVMGARKKSAGNMEDGARAAARAGKRQLTTAQAASPPGSKQQPSKPTAPQAKPPADPQYYLVKSEPGAHIWHELSRLRRLQRSQAGVHPANPTTQLMSESPPPLPACPPRRILDRHARGKARQHQRMGRWARLDPARMGIGLASARAACPGTVKSGGG